jgi:hypothetical protein
LASAKNSRAWPWVLISIQILPVLLKKQRPDLPAEFCKMVRIITIYLDEFPNM